MIPKPKAMLAIEGERMARQRRLPPWSLVIYFATLGLELNWAGASARRPTARIPVL